MNFGGGVPAFLRTDGVVPFFLGPNYVSRALFPVWLGKKVIFEKREAGKNFLLFEITASFVPTCPFFESRLFISASLCRSRLIQL